WFVPAARFQLFVALQQPGQESDDRQRGCFFLLVLGGFAPQTPRDRCFAGPGNRCRFMFSAAMSVRSTIAAAFTPIAIAIASETSSRLAPNLSAFLMCPSRQPWHFAARLAPIATSSLVL